MTTTTLWTDRSLNAVLKGIPVDPRAEVGKGLRKKIGGCVLERMVQGEDPEAAEKVVLRELGARQLTPGKPWNHHDCERLP
jgi:hypothetical protein